VATYTVSLAGSSVLVPITGTGDRPAQLEASGPLALGAAVVGNTTPAATVEITNAGDRDADITAVSLTGPNAGEVEPVAGPDACTDATTLAPGESCVLSARLAPTSPGAKQATYTVSLAGSSVAVAITGTGEAPPPPAGQNDGGGGSSTNDPPPPPPPPPSPSAAAVVVGTSAKAAKGGKVKLRLRCAAVGLARCAGTLTLKIGARKLTRTYSIAAGKDGLVTLKLAAGDRRKLIKRRSLSSTVSVITAQGDGSRRATHSAAFKLRS
jgi:hypothetical protein